jgi:hypothetical protein
MRTMSLQAFENYGIIVNLVDKIVTKGRDVDTYALWLDKDLIALRNGANEDP